MRSFLPAFFMILMAAPMTAAQQQDTSPTPAPRTQAETPLRQTYDVNSAPPGTLYFATETPGRVVAAPRLKADVTITITGPIVRTRVLQHFTNTGDAWVEGLYTYPLPKGSAVDTLEMKTGDRIIKGEIQEKAEAKRTFEAAKRAGKRASLVVQKRPNIFSTRLANIGPGETIEVAIEYQDLIEPHDNLFELRFPMVVRPRFNPGLPLDDRAARAGWGFDTDQVPDGSQITQPWMHDAAGRHNPVTLTIRLAPGFSLGSLESPSHGVDIAYTASGADIALRDGSTPADQDFILHWTPKPLEAPSVGLFTETTPDGRHHLLMLVPPVTAPAQQSPSAPRDLVIILDKSGSMGGQAIRQAKSAVRQAIMRLSPADQFNLIAFDNTPYPLFAHSRSASYDNIQKALDFLDDVDAGGGTMMADALNLALPDQGTQGVEAVPASAGLQQIIFITDGAVGNERALMEQIKSGLGAARLFTVGIGSAPNSYFMEEAAHFGRGAYANIAMNDDVGGAMASLFSKIEKPQLTDIQIDWPGGNIPEGAPMRLPDLYAGDPIVLTYRSATAMDGDIRVKGTRDGQTWSTTVAGDFGGDGVGVANLWARRAIRAINRDHIGRHAAADRTERRDTILALALDYHLVSDFTSLVAVDHTPARPPEAPLYKRETAANLPAGMDWDKRKVFTLADGAQMVSVSPRSTATPMQLYMMAGLALMLMALALLAIGGWKPCRARGRR